MITWLCNICNLPVIYIFLPDLYPKKRKLLIYLHPGDFYPEPYSGPGKWWSAVVGCHSSFVFQRHRAHLFQYHGIYISQTCCRCSLEHTQWFLNKKKTRWFNGFGRPWRRYQGFTNHVNDAFTNPGCTPEGLSLEWISSPSSSPDRKQNKVLKVLSALATVLVIDHEKVVVVAKNGNGGNVEIIACTDQIAVDKSPESLLKDLWNFVITENPRTDAGKEIAELYPTIHNPKDEPGHPKDSTLVNLKSDVKQHW